MNEGVNLALPIQNNKKNKTKEFRQIPFIDQRNLGKFRL